MWPEGVGVNKQLSPVLRDRPSEDTTTGLRAMDPGCAALPAVVEEHGKGRVR